MVDSSSHSRIDPWPAAAVLDCVAAEASALHPVPPHERRGVLRNEAGLLLDRLLATVARGRGALDVALGEGLAALGEGDRALQLGCSGIGDYARERLGIAGRTAQAMARLARELRSRPLLRDAVRRGDVGTRKAELVLPLARGDDEARWVERARSETVRALGAVVNAAAVQSADEEDPDWQRVSMPFTSEQHATLDQAMALAGQVLGATAPRWQRLEAICQEYLGAHAPDDAALAADELLCAPTADWLEGAKEALETGRWSWLEEVKAVAAPSGPGDELDLEGLDAELRRLAGVRERWDELLGHLAMLVKSLGLWRDMQFASFAHYCVERLGMAARTVEQRAWLARKLHSLPALRDAMRDGRISYEKARLVAGCADVGSAGEWIERAEKATCIELRREIEAREEAQMCARGELRLTLPRRAAGLLAAAFRAARTSAERWLTSGECLARISEHFIATWGPALAARSTRERKVLARDRGLCQVPGCSRAAAHAHHVVYRSHGGADEVENLVSICAAHHLHGVHRGFLRVHGRAPDGLRWELPNLPPVAPAPWADGT